ncbi:hatching enzyme 1.2-like [Clytia hemisphaerica]|uniref:Metalloendopeptidase n=1 Tax=Clytia hemisphaerica TaxID=252671 RepID=A0A7M5XA09_9CNID
MKILLLLVAFSGVVFSEWIKEMENQELFQGDIVLDPDEDERGLNKNTFASIKGGRWPNARIPYVIDGSISSRGQSAISAAISDYHSYTCIRFHRRTNERSYIKFYKGRGCSSPVGYRYGRVNSVSLASGCWTKGVVIHEIGHSIGLYHEQSRPDRDSHVRIQTQNIISGMAYNFNKQRSSNIDSKGTPYDFDSIMHYGPYAFARSRGLITIKTLDPQYQNRIGNRGGFSTIDKRQINLMYCGGSGGSGGNGGNGGNGGGSGSCSDKVTDCQKNIQGCRSWGQAWIDYMKKHCQKSCGFCR